MSSMTLLLIFAVGIISVWSEPIRVEFLERRNEEGQGIVQCLADGFVKVSGDMENAPPMPDEELVKKEACLFFQEMEKCIVNKIGEYQPPKTPPKILTLSAAIEYQHLFVAHKADLCKKVPLDKLKQVASESGALAQLEPVEGKQYDDCLRNVMLGCISKMMNDFKQQNNLKNPHFTYIECYKIESDNTACKPEMLGVFLSNFGIVKGEWEVAKKGNY